MNWQVSEQMEEWDDWKEGQWMEIEEWKVDRQWVDRWGKDGKKTKERQSSHPPQGGKRPAGALNLAAPWQ